jgi:hypothetical protein
MDAPPPYEEATGSAPLNRPSSSTTHLKARNGISPSDRRSMEDEFRPLPHGWFRQYDPTNQHQYFVDTNVDPPRSIWQHPYDDQQYLNSLDPKERQKVQGLYKIPSEADILAESSDDESHGHHGDHAAMGTEGKGHISSSSQQPKGIEKFGRKMKDKVTNSTHEQREAHRRQRAEEERIAYERHQVIRRAMSMAMQTGQPQPIGKGKDGREVYIEPPDGVKMPPGARGYNPYVNGPYANPNAMFVRPRYPYARPYGGGYGGGYGLPLAGGMAGGLMGGLLLGDMMGGGMMGGGF